ncbi:hypothetical protein ACFQY5_35905 [Paeniroseomonas aquatica]|uniref:hypothetical protein n=1 Tax=Paeniroseomonas aquatica TaxID=373043 RepID=UPI0036114C60
MDSSGDAWTFSIDKNLPGKVLDVILALFRPMFNFISEVSGASWLGAAIIFSIFFAVFLIRTGARSGISNMGVFAGALEHYASWGLLGSGAFLALLALEWIFMPVWTVFFAALVNSVTGVSRGCCSGWPSSPPLPHSGWRS